MTKILMGVLAVTVLLCGVLFYRYDREKEERVKAQAALSQVQLTLTTERENVKRQAAEIVDLNVRFMTVQSRADALINQMNGYRDRERLLQKKPKTIERLANAATGRMFNDILRASSGGDNQDSTTEPVTNTDN